MKESLVFTIIGDDRPGVVEQIARTVNEHDANWLGSRMSQLAGKFAGMIQVEGEATQLGALQKELEALSGLTVVVEPGGEAAPSTGQVIVTMLGLDRPGIVREVSAALAAENLNVLELQTDITQAAMTGDPMFNGRAVVTGRSFSDLGDLSGRLDEISAQLGIDIELLDED